MFLLTSFDAPLGPYFSSAEKFGARGGTQLIDYKNKALVTCTSNAWFRSATGASTVLLAAWWARPSSPRPDLQTTASAADLQKVGCGWLLPLF